jgi:hypothetical protein
MIRHWVPGTASQRTTWSYAEGKNITGSYAIQSGNVSLPAFLLSKHGTGTYVMSMSFFVDKYCLAGIQLDAGGSSLI